MTAAEMLYLVATAAVAGAGAYLGAYLRKKGENLATHEDIDKLVVQVKAVTEATKKIEAEISNEVWDRQRKWEIKRDALFEAVKELGTVQAMIGSITAAYKIVEVAKTPQEQATALQRANETLAKYFEAQAAFSRAMVLAEIVSGPDVLAAFKIVNATILIIVGKGMNEDSAGATAMFPDFVKAMEQLRSAIQKELGVG